MILALGQFVFAIDTLTFDEIRRNRAWNFASNSIAQGRDQYQFTGIGDETITIPFLIYQGHGFGHRQSIDDLSEMADTGAGYVLIDGTGYIYGIFAIESLDDTRSFLTMNGAPQKIDGMLKLKRVDDNRIQADKAPDNPQNTDIPENQQY